MPAFIDSIGEFGECGEKRVTLDSSPDFLSVVSDAMDPATMPFSINFNHTLALTQDIGEHEVKYTVSSVMFPTYVTSITGTFKLVIVGVEPQIISVR